MNTENLSKEANKGILDEAEKLNHDLTLQFEVLAEDCKDEEEYLKKAKELVGEIRTLSPEDLEDVFFGSITNEVVLHRTLDQILENIEKVEEMPASKKHFDF